VSDSASRKYGRGLLLWGGVIGFGLGAVVDVVIFHLVFQHHHLLSGYIDPTSYDGLRENVRYDGLFLSGMLGATVLGLLFVWRLVNGADRRLSGLYLAGSILVGAGVFNVFDGVVNHYVLDAHNVVHNTEAWNPHWVAVSLGLLVLGVVLLSIADGAVQSNQ